MNVCVSVYVCVCVCVCEDVIGGDFQFCFLFRMKNKVNNWTSMKFNSKIKWLIWRTLILVAPRIRGQGFTSGGDKIDRMTH